MKISILPASGHVAVDGVAHDLDLSDIDSDLLSPDIIGVHFDGEFGQIERQSKVPGRVDFEHLDIEDLPRLLPFARAFEAHVAKLAADQAAREKAEREAQEALEREQREAEASAARRKPKASDAA